MDVNATGTFFICRAALPWLRKARAATVVNVGSGQSLRPTEGCIAYGASKAAVLMLTRGMALELAPRIRVNLICPGPTDTEMLRGAMQGKSKAAVAAFLRGSYALARPAAATEIAAGILFLSSDESSFVTGVALPVDGGRSFH